MTTRTDISKFDKVIKKKKDVQINIVMTRELKDRIDRLTKKYNLSKCELVRQSIISYLDELEKTLENLSKK